VSDWQVSAIFAPFSLLLLAFIMRVLNVHVRFLLLLLQTRYILVAYPRYAVPFFVVTIVAFLVFTLAAFAFPNASTFEKGWFAH
jgi:hypothetical protein